MNCPEGHELDRDTDHYEKGWRCEMCETYYTDDEVTFP